MTKRIHHYILTRFCLRLWTRDKNGETIDWEKWIAGRMELFEQYCLPSVMAQTCKEFRWVLLCDDMTPEWVRERLREYKERCPQIKVAYVPTPKSGLFPKMFCGAVVKLLEKDGVEEGDLCLTTYLDNDDALHEEYVLEVQNVARRVDATGGNSAFSLDEGVKDPFFMSFDYGVQYFTELQVATRICYPSNHFMTVVEYPVVVRTENGAVSVRNVRTCYGYGSHFLLEKNRKVRVEHVIDRNRLMWAEIVHECNVDNDVKMTLDSHMLDAVDGFGCGMMLGSPRRLAYMRRCLQQMWRRARNKLMPRRP